jgi:hypothetical protein
MGGLFMKQLIIILLLAGGCYYLYYSGFLKISDSTNLSPKEFINNIQSAADIMAEASVKNLPEKDPQRNCGASISQSNINALESVVFAAYDSKAAYALADLTYSCGLREGRGIIDKYLSLFNTAEEKSPILSIITKYKDKESLDILVRFSNRGTFSRRILLRKIADFKSPEAAEAIRDAANDNNAALKSEAKILIEEFKNEPWFNAPPKKRTLAAQHTRDLYNIPLGNP